MTQDQVMEEVRRLEKEEGPHAFVSLTGGEPLLYLGFLRPLMMRLKAEGFRIYLETNGILWQALEEVIGWCDCVAMDMKPSSVTGERRFDAEHKNFLRLARSKEVFIKMVLSKGLDVNEFEELLGIVAETAPQTPVILQPVSGDIEGHDDPELMEFLSYVQRLGMRLVRDIRIVPRLHRILKIR